MKAPVKLTNTALSILVRNAVGKGETVRAHQQPDGTTRIYFASGKKAYQTAFTNLAKKAKVFIHMTNDTTCFKIKNRFVYLNDNARGKQNWAEFITTGQED